MEEEGFGRGDSVWGLQVLGCPEHLNQAFERQLRSSRESQPSLGDGRGGDRKGGREGGMDSEQGKNRDQFTNKVVSEWLIYYLSSQTSNI